MIGLRELALVAVVVLVLYGRSGVLKSRQFQTIWPGSPPRGGRRPGRAASPARSKADVRRGAACVQPFLRGNRLFWFLTILAATAVAAWIVTA